MLTFPVWARPMRFWPAGWAGWLRAVLLLAGIAAAIWLLLPTPPQLALAAGQPAPDFAAETLAGAPVSLAAYRGQPVLLVFVDPDCGPSRRIVAQLNAVQAARPDVHLVVVGPAAATVESLRAYQAETGARFELWRDITGAAHAIYRPYGTPFVFFVDSAGVIERTALGEHQPSSLLNNVNRYLKEAR